MFKTGIAIKHKSRESDNDRLVRESIFYTNTVHMILSCSKKCANLLIKDMFI